MRALLAGVIFSVSIIVTIELCYRVAGGSPGVVPGWTKTEFQWKIKEAQNHPRTIYVLGDSRVGWGFAEKVFEKEVKRLGYRNVKAVNASLPGGNLPKMISHILKQRNKPCVMVVNFTFYAFYIGGNDPGSPIPNLKLQDYVDERINNTINECFFTYGRGYRVLMKHFKDAYGDSPVQKNPAGYSNPKWSELKWFSRTVFDEGFVSGELRYPDGSRADLGLFQLDNYSIRMRKILADPSAYNPRRQQIVSLLSRAQKDGWLIVLVRIPVGSRMQRVEEALPRNFAPRAIAKELSVSFCDYQFDARTISMVMDTLEESHIRPDQTGSLAVILAQDIAHSLPQAWKE
jgi:hypothetical protein